MGKICAGEGKAVCREAGLSAFKTARAADTKRPRPRLANGGHQAESAQNASDSAGTAVHGARTTRRPRSSTSAKSGRAASGDTVAHSIPGPFGEQGVEEPRWPHGSNGCGGRPTLVRAD